MDGTERTAWELMERIYEAAFNPASWTQFLEDFTAATDADAGSLFLQNRTTTQPIEVHSFSGFEPAFIESYLQYYGGVSPWLPKVDQLNIGTSYTGDSIISKRELEKSEFFADWLQPQGLAGGTTSIVKRDSESNLILSVLYQDPEKHCAKRVEYLYSVLVPHLRRAFTVCQHLSTLSERVSCLECAFMQLATPVFIVDESCRIVFCNSQAELLLAEEDCLRVRQGCVEAMTNDGNTLLRKAIQRAFSERCDREIEDVIAVPRTSSGGSEKVLVIPIQSSRSPGPKGKRQSLMIVGDFDKHATVSDRSLAKLFNLLPTHARFAVSYFNNSGDLKATAYAQSLSIESARTYLKEIFAKTEVHSQPELIKLLSFLPTSHRTTDRPTQ